LRVHAGEGLEDLAVDRRDRLRDTLAAEALGIAVAQLAASWAPVEAPDGTAARPNAPSSSVTSTSTVGLPRLSRISRPVMSMIAGIAGSDGRDDRFIAARRGAAVHNAGTAMLDFAWPPR
jgi:hypothetical protein